MLDYLDAIYAIQQRINNFRKTASSSVYDSYLSLENQANSDQMCKVSDSYFFSQRTRISIIYLISLRHLLYRAKRKRTRIECGYCFRIRILQFVLCKNY